MTKHFMTRILIALFALSLISGMAVAQAAKKPAKTLNRRATPICWTSTPPPKTNSMLCRESERPTRRKSSTAVPMRRRPTW